MKIYIIMTKLMEIIMALEIIYLAKFQLDSNLNFKTKEDAGQLFHTPLNASMLGKHKLC